VPRPQMSPQTEAHHHLLPHRQLPALKTHCVLPIFIFPALVNNATTAIPANSPSPMRVMSTYRVVEKLHGMADIIDPFPFAVDDQRSPLPCHRLSSPPPQHCQHRCRRLRFSFVDMELRGDPPELGKHGDLHLVASSPVAAASPPPLVRNPPPLVAPLLPCATTTTTLPGDFALTASAHTADRVPPEPPFRRQPRTATTAPDAVTNRSALGWTSEGGPPWPSLRHGLSALVGRHCGWNPARFAGFHLSNFFICLISKNAIKLPKFI
jgi:hypothetical protein